MKTNWDYSNLADAYLKRPDYSVRAIDKMFDIAGLTENQHACDVGAGVAHLTLQLAARGLKVVAVEPNDAMRKNGIERTKHLDNVRWFEGTGEETGQADSTFDIVTFGSSFNVTERAIALRETARILKPSGWFACMWNHRDLDDPIQSKIESIINQKIPGYNYGSRREDQTEIIAQSNLYGEVIKIEGSVTHRQSVDDCIEAWRSHATLERQAKGQFHTLIYEIEQYLHELSVPFIEIPYTTRVWMAQVKKN